VIEILHGLHKDIANPGKAQQFKRSAPAEFEFLDVPADIGYLASEIIAKLEGGRQAIGFPDSLIAATAIYHGLTLVTANTRHFQRVIAVGFPLKLENWRDA
jgi:predicted nucleic acid-binding protein